MEGPCLDGFDAKCQLFNVKYWHHISQQGSHPLLISPFSLYLTNSGTNIRLLHFTYYLHSSNVRRMALRHLQGLAMHGREPHFVVESIEPGYSLKAITVYSDQALNALFH